jgi:predicted kinase
MDHSITGFSKRNILERLTLVLLMGVPGSGKTTLANEILKGIWLVYLDNNFIADAFFLKTRTDPEYLSLRKNLYDVLYRVADENLRVCNSVLLDAPHVTQMQDEDWRKFISHLASRNKAELAVIRCFCSEKTLHRRITERAEMRDHWKLENWPEFLRREPLKVPIPFPHLEIDTDESLESNTKKITRFLFQKTD